MTEKLYSWLMWKPRLIVTIHNYVLCIDYWGHYWSPASKPIESSVIIFTRTITAKHSKAPFYNRIIHDRFLNTGKSVLKRGLSNLLSHFHQFSLTWNLQKGFLVFFIQFVYALIAYYRTFMCRTMCTTVRIWIFCCAFLWKRA